MIKLENDLNTKPTYVYINYLKATTIIYHEKDLAQENINKYKPDEE